jgi:DnaJ like chaperone protein
MRLAGEQRARAQESFRQGKEADFPLRDPGRVSPCQPGQRDILRFFLEVQLQAAFADGKVEANERAILHTIADELGFSRIELARILAMAEAQMNFFNRAHRMVAGGSNTGRRPPPVIASRMPTSCWG